MPYKILIADDDREHLLMVAYLCRQAGYEVVSAADAQNALQMAVEQAPDLLLLDVHMGATDGFAVQKRLQEMNLFQKPLVIYLTGDPSASIECMGMAHSAQAVLRKPFEPAALLAAIAKAFTDAEAAAGLTFIGLDPAQGGGWPTLSTTRIQVQAKPF